MSLFQTDPVSTTPDHGFTFRPYQRDAIDSVLDEFTRVSSTLIVEPTGTGKTVIFAEIIRIMTEHGGRALVIAHRFELIQQAYGTIKQIVGSTPDIEMADQRADNPYEHRHDGPATTVIASVQTLNARQGDGKRMERFDPMDFKILVIDEAHHAVASSYQAVIDWYLAGNPDGKILGVTATPDRADESALGKVFDTVAHDYEINQAIDDGWLVPIDQEFVTVKDLDFSQIGKVAGDFNQGQLDQAIMSNEKILHELASATVEIARGRKVLFFTTSVAAAARLCEIINRYGVNNPFDFMPGKAMWVCGETEKWKRRQDIDAFRSGAFQYMCNVGIATEGFDVDDIDVIAMGRPTMSRALYAQMVGRGTRPRREIVTNLNATIGLNASEDYRRQYIAESAKPNLLVIDFVGNSGKHHLMSTADILGGEYDDVVRERAVRRVSEADAPMGMREALTKAEAEIEEEELQEKAQAEVDRRQHVVGRGTIRRTKRDAFSVLGLNHRSTRDWHGRAPTDRRRNALTKFKVDEDQIEGLDYNQCQQLIIKLIDRAAKGLCFWKQARMLEKHGYNPDLTRKEAGDIMGRLAKNGWRPLR